MDDLSRSRRNYRTQVERLHGMKRARENAIRRMEDCRKIIEQCDRRIPVVERWVENARRQMEGFGDAARRKKLQAIANIYEELKALGVEIEPSPALEEVRKAAENIDSVETEPSIPHVVQASSIEEAIDKVANGEG